MDRRTTPMLGTKARTALRHDEGLHPGPSPRRRAVKLREDRAWRESARVEADRRHAS
jgi:hypothetical protein